MLKELVRKATKNYNKRTKKYKYGIVNKSNKHRKIIQEIMIYLVRLPGGKEKKTWRGENNKWRVRR